MTANVGTIQVQYTTKDYFTQVQLLTDLYLYLYLKIRLWQWMAPEVLCGKSYSESSDIYSLGLVHLFLLVSFYFTEYNRPTD